MSPKSQARDAVDFKDIRAEAPDIDSVTAEYRQLETAWESAPDGAARLAAFRGWDTLRRRLSTWEALTRLRFDQDTRDAERKAARERLDELSPKLTALEIEMKNRLLTSPHRKELEQQIGGHAFALWDADVTTFAPEIEGDLTREAQLEAEYTELVASAQLEIDGQRVNLSGIDPYTQSTDRDVRHRAQQTKWAFFSEHGDQLDRIYDDLVRLRHDMARKLGFDNFIGLGYKRMHRLDYDQTDVERYRDLVVRDIVPVAAEIMRRRAEVLGLAEAAYWDETLVSPSGNPQPKGDHDWIVQRGAQALAEVDREVGQFYEMMIQHQLVDLKNRDGKAGGGYCTSFPTHGVPFVYANFNGTHHDVHVLVHEMGHAFQDWNSMSLPAYDYVVPTFESAEIHSISMEYLARPFMEHFFNGDADRYRRQQLEDAMLFLPYGVAVDHFQHLVYANPEAGPAQRHEMWKQVESRYLPWRRYADIAYLAKGGLWQDKVHIYHMPFYYIDYTLALCCALQFWARSRRDYALAVSDYIALCKRGGEAAFRELIRSANLASPFDEGALARVAAEARADLALTERGQGKSGIY